jgi:hypothetical protein
VGDQRNARPLYPRERPGWVGPRAGLDGCGKSRPPGVRSPDRPARSDSLYRLSYAGPHCHHYTWGKQIIVPFVMSSAKNVRQMKANIIRNIQSTRNNVIKTSELSSSHPTQTSPKHLFPSAAQLSLRQYIILNHSVRTAINARCSRYVLREWIDREFLSAGCLNWYLHMKAECDVIHSDGASERLIL